jgi:hypothetical protein
MGRITPSFRQLYFERLDKLKKHYVGLLRDPAHRNAFQLLLREAWDREHAAMSNAEIPFVLDALNLTASVHIKAEIITLKQRLEESQHIVRKLEEKLKVLEERKSTEYTGAEADFNI